MNHILVCDKRARAYAIISIVMLAWTIALILLAVTIFPISVYWFSYYAVDYKFGFVRRGLAGEIIDIFPAEYYFGATLTMQWLSTATFLISLASVLWLVVYKGKLSDRRIMLALLIPVLPFSVAFSLFSARPDLFGAAALVAYSISLSLSRSHVATVASSTFYGLSTAVLVLVHEAVALEFTLGAILAILALSKVTKPVLRGLCTLLSVGPGFASTLVVALLGRDDIGTKLCSRVPHKTMNYMIAGHMARTDYHDWVCRNITPIYSYGVANAVRIVAGVGFFSLLGSFILGLFIFCVTMYAISYFSGTPLGDFASTFRGKMTWLALGMVSTIPLFMTGFDWTRWWTIISFDTAIVYILYVIDRPQIEGRADRKSLKVLVVFVTALLLFPIGIIPGFGGPLMK